MSLDIFLEKLMPTTVFDANITHNLGKMAQRADVYQALWRPEELGVNVAKDLTAPLTRGMNYLLQHEWVCVTLDTPINAWGSYNHLLEVVKEYRQACIDHPDATVRVSR